VATLLGHEKLETTALHTHPSEPDLERATGFVEQESLMDR
jgi:hypothetical protein